MVLSHLIAMEHAQIGLIKAPEYGRRKIAGHYLMLAGLIGVFRVLAEWVFSWYFADAMIRFYGDFLRFPCIIRDWGTQAMVVSAVLGMATVVLGGLRAVW